jgi:PBP1b-binding outer membrane lipoprotein LpoB
MKSFSKILAIIITALALTACIGQDEGKMQGNKAAEQVTK